MSNREKPRPKNVPGCNRLHGQMPVVASSTLLTLLVLPTYYTLFDDLAEWLKRTWLASNPSPAKAPAEPVASG